jgi:putative membrane protein
MRGIHSAAAALAAGLIGLAAMPLPAHALGYAAGTHAAKPLAPEQRQERQFLRDAAAHLRFQHDASRLAIAKSGDGNVRQVAASLLNHCTATQPEVLHLLHVRGMAMPLLGGDEAKVLRQLARLTGAKFDRLYMQEVALRSNQLDAVQYERIAGVTRDPQLQAWVERQLPTVRYHVSLASRGLPGEAARLARGVPATGVMGAGPAGLFSPRNSP